MTCPVKKAIILSVISFILSGAPVTLSAGEGGGGSGIVSESVEFRVTYEVLTLPGDESMGFAGFNYLLNIYPWLYSGLGVYSAEYGERGGFFTGGLDTGVMFNVFSGVNLCVGLFAGGGGGGAAPQGGGLMLRPYAGVLYDFEFIKLGGGVSRDIFPNGDIDSTQGYFQVDIPFTVLLAAHGGSEEAVPADEKINSGGVAIHRISAIYQTYFPADGVKTTEGNAGDKNFGLAGIAWSRELSNNIFMHMQAAGAMKGDADGYAELFFGGGARYYLSENIGCELKASAGGAGFIISIGGEFDILSEGPGLSPVSAGDFFRPGRWRVRLRNRSYLPSENMRKKSDSEEAVHLVAFSLDRFFSDHIYISGQAVGAYSGGAGGYAEGLFGAGLITGDLFNGLRF